MAACGIAMSGEDIEQTNGEETLRTYTWDEIKEHQSSESLWIVVHDKVYDVTEFMEEVGMIQ